ncbi:pore-forming ESAT-6 family protein [Streptomyces avidinii]|uniref:pore-forming ESAT-6 family protein n=1 Tax=Streptomyces avidinii TaxID=1895 RepID=UPI00386F54E5|nr:pore-forming ESAT-6 family protein [Streptomyces avidinii]WTA98231.1 pore-forming ESAT-6 family protein [Streptomyces avidinii]
MSGGTDRRAYDVAASTEVQGGIKGVIGQLDMVIAAREAQVAAAMSDFTAEGVADDYHAKEQRWKNASQEVKNIIQLLNTTLEKNDATAQQTLQRARTAVNNIG